MKTSLPQFVATLRYGNAANPSAAEVAKRARFLEKYPAQEANILSYQDKPDCKCSRDIVQAISADPNKQASLDYIAGEHVEIITPTQAVGKIITIDDREEDYLALTQRFQTEMFMFRGLTIVPVVIDGVAKLRVFFY
jgi:hypothetical protein